MIENKYNIKKKQTRNVNLVLFKNNKIYLLIYKTNNKSLLYLYNEIKLRKNIIRRNYISIYIYCL